MAGCVSTEEFCEGLQYQMKKQTHIFGKNRRQDTEIMAYPPAISLFN